MIYDLIYHCKRGLTKVQFSYLAEAFDTNNLDEICSALEAEKIKIIRIDHTGWTLIL